MISPVAAGGALASVIPSVTSGHAATSAAGSDFESMLASLASDTRQSLKTGESAAIAGLTGKMPLQQVVGAVMEAEQSLTVAIAVRDKAVAAYSEISRMSI